MKNKLLKVILAFMMAFGIQAATLKSVNATTDLSQAGTYTVPVTSLVSAAPLPPVQVAFSKAFGENIEVEVDENGNQVATIQLQHMVVDMSAFGMGQFDANVLLVENAEVLSTRDDVFSNPNGDLSSPAVQQNITVPDQIKLPLSLDEKNSQKISITVDFMNYLLGGGNDYPTTVTLTLDVDHAVLNNPIVKETESAFNIYYNGASGRFEKNFADKVKVSEYADGTYTLTLTANSLGDDAKYVEVDEPENVSYVDNKDGTRTFTFVVSSKDKLYNQYQFNFAYHIVAMDRTNTHEFYLELAQDDDSQYNLLTKDGTYTVNVALWNADKDQASMAASALDEKATIVVKDGQATMYITTKEMTFGTIKACLQELYIGSINDDYKSQPATILAKDSAGNPTMWSFALTNEEEYIDVVVNPHVEMMGNADLGARIKVDYTTLNYVSDSIEAPESGNNNGNSNDTTNTTDKNSGKDNNQTASTDKANHSVTTGDQTSMTLMGGLLMVSLAGFAFLMKKRLCK